MTSAPVTEADLHAYADGLLDDARRAEVDAWLATRPEQAAEVAAWQRQAEGIHALFDPIAAQPVPARLSPHALAAMRGRPGWAWPAMAAAAVVLLAIGVSSGYLLRNVVDPVATPATLLVENAVTAHALFVKENRHAVEVAANEQEHLLSWLSNRIRADIDAPDLSAEGFALVGGRLLPAGQMSSGSPAAQLMYENASSERVTVYITHALADKKDAYEFLNVASLDAFYWANDKITCTVVGALPEAEMQTVARKVYQQLTRRPDYRRG